MLKTVTPRSSVEQNNKDLNEIRLCQIALHNLHT